MTHNSLVASQRPHISLIDRRHFDYAALPIGLLIRMQACLREAGGRRSPLDSIKPYQRPGCGAPKEARSADSQASLTNRLLDHRRSLQIKVVRRMLIQH